MSGFNNKMIRKIELLQSSLPLLCIPQVPPVVINIEALRASIVNIILDSKSPIISYINYVRATPNPA